jgi:RNase P/RNase MRP subunit POP5
MVKPKNRKRYILFKISSNKEFELKSVERAIKASILRFLGESEFGNINPAVLPEYWGKNQGVLRVTNVHIPKIKISLALIKEIEGSKVIVQTLRIFGTLKKIKERF